MTADDHQQPEATRHLWRRWTLAFTIGELVGFGGIPVLGAAIALALTSHLDPATRSLVLYVVAVTGGLGEGAVLGWFQMRVLHRVLPQVREQRWILATAAAAALAWALGMLAPTLDDLVGLSPAEQIAIWVPSGIVILLTIGTAQALVMKGVVDRPRRWVTANVIGWLAGLPWTFVLPAMLPENSSPPVWILTFVVAGTLMGLTAGAITGRTLIQMARQPALP